MTPKKTNKQKFLFTILFFLLITGSFGLGRIDKVHAAGENLGEAGAISADDIEFVKKANAENAKSKNDDVCPGVSLFEPKTIFNCFLLIVLRFLGMILEAAAALFNWVINPENMKAVIDNKVIYETWAMVRDTLNIAFILVLLFSAFATVFQVDKYSYKSLLKTLIIMALLVNFSYPISRFIIDFSNSLMYYFINNLGMGDITSFSSKIAKDSALGQIIAPKGGAASDTSFLLASVIFVWIFAVTILIIAGLFLIRIVALAILIIFSSLAFTGSIVPFLSGWSGKWWDNLFKYAFFGPVMVFMLNVAMKMMSSINASSFGKMAEIAGKQSSNPSVIAAMAFFAIPIIILWAGIMFAQNMSLIGADAVIGRGKKFMKWAPSAVGAGTWGATKWGAKQTGIPGGLSQKWDNYKKTGPFFGSNKREEREARMAGKGPFAVPHATDQADAKRIKEAKEAHDMEHMLTGDLQNMKKTGNKFEQAAAIQELASKNQAKREDLDQIRAAFGDKNGKGGENSQTFKALVDKVKTYDPTAAFSHITNEDERTEPKKDFMNSSQFDVKKLNANSLGDDELMEIMFAENAISTKDIMDISKGSPGKKTAMNGVLKNLAAKNIAMTENNKKIHAANFAQTGEIANDDFAEDIFSNANADTIANIKDDTAAKYAYFLARFGKNNYKKTLEGIKSDTARRAINEATLDIDKILPHLSPEEAVRANSAQKMAQSDPRLMNMR